MIKIIDHKKVELTNDEYLLYQKICKSYDDVHANRKGEDLFKDLFEVNEEGIIIFVKPPTQRYSSLEVFCFLLSIMQNQHLRIIHDEAKSLIKEAEKILKEKNKKSEKELDVLFQSTKDKLDKLLLEKKEVESGK